jgi:hypothetical protein
MVCDAVEPYFSRVSWYLASAVATALSADCALSRAEESAEAAEATDDSSCLVVEPAKPEDEDEKAAFIFAPRLVPTLSATPLKPFEKDAADPDALSDTPFETADLKPVIVGKMLMWAEPTSLLM